MPAVAIEDAEAQAEAAPPATLGARWEALSGPAKKAIVGGVVLVLVIAIAVGVSVGGGSGEEPKDGGETPGGGSVPDDELVAAFQENKEACFKPSSLAVELGTLGSRLSDDSAKRLADKELSGSENTEGDFIKCETDAAKQHETGILFEIPAWLPVDMVEGVAADVNFRGEPASGQDWAVEIRGDGKWVKLWDNAEGDPDKWTAGRGSAPIQVGDFTQFTGSDGAVKLRIISRGLGEAGADGMFDMVNLCVTTEGGPAPPVMSPTPMPPSPAPTPGAAKCFRAGLIEATRNGEIAEDHADATALEVKDLEGSADDWNKFVEFKRAPGKPDQVYEITVPVSGAPEIVGAVSTSFTYRGARATSQEWRMEVRNVETSEWVTVADNTGAVDWVWMDVNNAVVLAEAVPSSEFVKDGKMTWRWMSTSTSDSSQIDYARFCLTPSALGTTAAPTAAPIAAPTAAPTAAPAAPTPPTPGITESPTASPSQAPTVTPPPPIDSSTCPARSSFFPKSAYQSLVCGIYIINFDINDRPSRSERAAVLQERKDSGCGMLMLDSVLSYYMDLDRFKQEVAFIDTYAKEAKEDFGLPMVIYYPSLEVVTKNGENIPDTIAKLHPDWVQKSLGTQELNVFYGSKEIWVNPGEESAWMNPESPGFLAYFFERCRLLAATNLEGLWPDVPLYYDTGTAWAGGSDEAIESYEAWTAEKGLCGGSPCDMPDHVRLQEGTWDYTQDEFSYWIAWRHHSIANFLNKLRIEVQSINPAFYVMVENYPADYLDGALVSLDGSWFTPEMRQGMSTVWEIDSVSNYQGMKFAHPEDLANQFTMRKYARGVDKDSPTWAFAYGNERTDQEFVLGGAFAIGTNPLETKTPSMTSTVDLPMRTAWGNWAMENNCAIFEAPRKADAAILYSGATRDFVDLETGGGYCMYADTQYPGKDDAWWATVADNTVKKCRHIGSYRGASLALQMLNVPFKIVTDWGLEASDLDGVKFLWLPYVEAIPDSAVEIITAWVNAGGTLFSTDKMPGTMNGYGRSRGFSLMHDLIGTLSMDEYTAKYGAGVSYLRTDINSKDVFTVEGGTLAKQNAVLDAVERIVRIHVPETFVPAERYPNLLVEQSVPYDNKQHLYMVNYIGARRPMQREARTLTFWYRAPTGYQVQAAVVSTPNGREGESSTATEGTVAFERSGNQGWIKVTAVVDVFSMFTFTLEPLAAIPAPAVTGWSNQAWKTASDEALTFILEKMRQSDDVPYPWNLGVFTNFIDTTENDPLYAYGHHTTSEHMGLFMRVAACLGNKQAYDDGLVYIDKIMVSPLYKLVNWAMDRRKQHAFLSYDSYEKRWVSSTAPLDDFRTIQGMMEGHQIWNVPSGQRVAEEALNAIYWTTVSDRYRNGNVWRSLYPGGLIGISWDWSEVNDLTLRYDGKSAPSTSSGKGSLYDVDIAVNYQDLYMIEKAAHFNPRFIATLESSLDLILDAEITSYPDPDTGNPVATNNGLFWNTRYATSSGQEWFGDWEYRYSPLEKFLKTIQELWIGIHLAKVGKFTSNFLPQSKRDAAVAAAQKLYDFYKAYYLANNKIIPEYLSFGGEALPRCIDEQTNKCMWDYDNSDVGEPRIYSQLIRLGHILGGDDAFLATVVDDKLMTDRVTDTSDPRYGMFGTSALNGRDDDSDAWNSLETVLGICMFQTGFGV